MNRASAERLPRGVPTSRNERAVSLLAEGATILREPEEPGIGFRIYSAEDLEGHRWMFGQRSA